MKLILTEFDSFSAPGALLEMREHDALRVRHAALLNELRVKNIEFTSVLRMNAL